MSSVIRPQYCTFNTSIAVQHIQMCVQVNHVKQATTRLAYCAGIFFLNKNSDWDYEPTIYIRTYGDQVEKA